MLVAALTNVGAVVSIVKVKLALGSDELPVASVAITVRE